MNDRLIPTCFEDDLLFATGRTRIVVPAKVYGFWRLVGARWCKQRLGVARESRDMPIKLHKNATTAPRQRAYIQASDKSVADLAGELGVSEMAVRRWKAR